MRYFEAPPTFPGTNPRIRPDAFISSNSLRNQGICTIELNPTSNTPRASYRPSEFAKLRTLKPAPVSAVHTCRCPTPKRNGRALLPRQYIPRQHLARMRIAARRDKDAVRNQEIVRSTVTPCCSWRGTNIHLINNHLAVFAIRRMRRMPCRAGTTNRG